MDELWIGEDISLTHILFTPNNAPRILSGYYEHMGGHSVYLNYDNWTNYTAHSEYGDYNNTCVNICQICNTGQAKCDINQYISYWINQFDYASTNDLIKAENYNKLITYINNAANWMNGLIDKYSLDENLKVTPFNQNAKVNISDIYEATDFNIINDKINNFINGVTNIINKVQNQDLIKKEDMDTFKTVLNQIKISRTIPCCQTSGHESCATRQD